MPLQDVSDDHLMISWLRQSGHGHLLEGQLHNANTASSSSPPPLPFNMAGGQATSSSPPSLPFNMPGGQVTSSSPPSLPFNMPGGQATSSSNYPPQSNSLSSPPPIFGGGGYNPSSPAMNIFNQSSSFPKTDLQPTSMYGGATGQFSPPIIPPTNHFNAPSYDHQSSPFHFSSSPTQFLAPNMNQQQLDVDIENMKRDPNTRVVQRPPQDDVVYKQRVFVRYLQPPTPPVGGTIIVREKQPPGPPPDPPIIIKRAPPPPPTPPPVIIRERPPPFPAAEGTTVIDKIIPAGPKPPRQVVIEQYPQLPPKPQDVIIERWLPIAPRQRRILYERLPPSSQQATRPIIVQYGPPHVRVQREVITAPGAQLPFQQATGHMDHNQVFNTFGGSQHMQSSLLPSSLVSYNPHTAIQPSYGSFGQSQPNIVIMQNGQPHAIPPSAYGTPLTCVCTPNQAPGLGLYGSGVSSIPMMGQSSGQSTIYNVPESVPLDNILRQLGIDPHTIQRSASLPPTDPRSALSHVWNAASHANPPHTSDPNTAVSHIWNAAAHAADHNRPVSPAVGHAWDKIEHFLHPQSNNAVQSVWNHIPHPYPPPGSPPMNYPPPPGNYPPPNSSPPPPPNYPPPSNYPPPPSNYPPPSSNYPPPSSNYPPPSSNYPPPSSNYPPPSSNYPPSSSNYPPPSSNYPPSSSNYPPPPSNYPPPPSNNPPSPPNYSPPPPSSYPPSGGPSGAGGGVLSRLFGGGR